jgi:hypothetical protein
LRTGIEANRPVSQALEEIGGSGMVFFFYKGVLMFTDKTSIDKELYHLIFDYRFHELRHGCCQSYWAIIIWISRVTFLKIGVIKDVNQIAGKMLFSKLKVKARIMDRIIHHSS